MNLTTPGAGTRKLLYLDSWTLGIHNFARLHTLLRSAGVEASLLHTGSWRDQRTPPTEWIGDIFCQDISSFGTRLVPVALRRLRPDGVLLLNTNFMMDRSVILACRDLGIRSIYLQHGVLPDFESFAAIVPLKDPQYLTHRGRRMLHYLRYHLPNYLFAGSLRDRWFPLRADTLRYLSGLFRHPTQYLFYPPPSREMQCDLALVYSNKDRDLHMEGFGYPPERVTVVGNPNLDDALRPQHPVREELLGVHGLPAGPYALYLEDAFVADKWEGWTPRSRADHLVEIAGLCGKAGYHLAVKLHPQSVRHMKEGRSEIHDNVTWIADANLADLVRLSEVCIGHLSSTIRLPILMGKPVLVPRWGISAALPAYYPSTAVSYCSTPDGMLDLLLRREFRYDRQAYVDHEMTLADGSASHRIVQRIVEALHGSSG